MNAKIKLVGLGAVVCAAAAVGLATLTPPQPGESMLRTEQSPTAPDSVSGKPYSVTMSPAGEVHFAHVPARVVTLDANYNDILAALGEEGKLVATGYRDNSFDGFYKQVAGDEAGSRLDAAKLTYLATPGGGMFDKELLYALRADVHHIDPIQLASSRGWSRADVDEIARNVGPFVANRYSRDNNYAGSEPYEYYTVWELSGKIADVYQRAEYIQGLKSIYDRLVSDIRGKLPPEEKRPRVGLVYYNNGRFTTYSITHDGFGQAHYRDVGARDAFERIEQTTYGGAGGSAGTGTALDTEGLLELNPDVLIMAFAVYQGAARTRYEQLLKLKMIRSSARGCLPYKQCIPRWHTASGTDLLSLPDRDGSQADLPGNFGPYRDDQKYPVEEQLFDRSELAKILNGHS